jgi:hypothetical protein
MFPVHRNASVSYSSGGIMSCTTYLGVQYFRWKQARTLSLFDFLVIEKND